jgi:uncharacterized protein YbjT (DUF2867 family)
VRLSPAWIQPIVSDDVATEMALAAMATPSNSTIEIAGPQRFHLAELVQRYLVATKYPRAVKDDVHARYFGAHLTPDMLMPGAGARLASTTFEQWMNRQ